MGLFPNNDSNALFRYLIAKDNIPEKGVPLIIGRINANRNLLWVITDMLSKTFISGYLLQFPAAGDVMTQQKSRYYYRGEHAYFRSLLTLWRYTISHAVILVAIPDKGKSKGKKNQ